MLEAMLTHRPHRKDGSHLDMQSLATEMESQVAHKDSPSAWNFTATSSRRMMAITRLKLRAAVARAAHALVRALFYSSCCLICFWFLHAGTLYWTDGRYWKLPKSGLKPYFGCQRNLLGNNCPQQQLLYQDLLYMLLVPAVLATSAILLLTLSASRSYALERCSRFQRWMTVMLPPRRFWLRWCDGMTVHDSVVITIWLTVNISWFSAVASRNVHQKLTKLHLTNDTPKDSPQNSTATSLFLTAHLVQTLLQGQQQADRALVIKTVYKCIARSLGSVLFPNLTALFYPVARGSVVLQALNIPYPAAIRYHRWLGHVCLTLTSTHALLYWAIWMYEGRWLTIAFKQDPDFNYLFGGISFLFGLALWTTSLESIRRSNYVLFKTMHLVGFWGWLLCAICHNWYLFWFCLPGLLLYCIDAVYQLHQATTAAAAKPHSSNSTYLSNSSSRGSGVQVLKAVAASDLSMCSLLISCTDYSSAGTGFIWLFVPELQRWGTWHPFEYITVPLAAATTTISSSSSSQVKDDQPTAALLVHIKAYSRWTRQLVQLVAVKGTAVGVRIQGPYAKRPGPVAPCLERTTCVIPHNTTVNGLKDKIGPNGLIMIAGGMGASAVLSVLSELEAAAATDLPVLLIWICRSITEFEFMGPRVLSMAAAAAHEGGEGGGARFHLSVQLFLTGRLPSHLTLATPNPAAALQQSINEQQLASRVIPPLHAKEDATVQVLDSTSSDSCSCTPLLLQTPVMQHPTAACLQSELVMSPLCPVTAVSGLRAQAGHKLLMHLAVYAGVIMAILVARYLSLIRPAEPWPTARMGALYAAVIVAAGLAAGSTVLLLTPVLRQQQLQVLKAGRWYERTPIHGLVPHSELNTSEQSVPDFIDLEASKHPHCCSGLQAVGVVAQAGVMGKVTAAVSPAAAAAGSQAGNAAAHDVTLQLEIPAVDGVCKGSSWPIELGRPLLQQLVTTWLASPKVRSSSGAGAADVGHGSGAAHKSVDGDWPFSACVQQYNVYCMGPTALVHSVMLMCDDLNMQRSRSGASDRDAAGSRLPVIYLQCIRETWEL